jgi:hypothetical protein
MPTPSSGRRSSKSGPSGNDAYKSSERREKAKSSQVYESARRGSKQSELGSVAERPKIKSRTNSAPLIEPRGRYEARASQTGNVRGKENAARGEVGVGAGDAQDEDEVAGVVGAVKHFSPFQNPEV